MIDIIFTFLFVCLGLLGIILVGVLIIYGIGTFLELNKPEQLFIVGFITIAILITIFCVMNDMTISPLGLSTDTDNDTDIISNHTSSVTPVVKPIIPVTNPSTGVTTSI